jgi:hypothetical protein
MTRRTLRDPDDDGVVHSSRNEPGQGHSPLRQIRLVSTDRESISDSQTDSAGSIPVFRSTAKSVAIHTSRAPFSHLDRGPSAAEISTLALEQKFLDEGQDGCCVVGLQAAVVDCRCAVREDEDGH